MSLTNRIFEKIHASSLIYNTCWEDPRCDRELLAIGPASRVVVLTSAGCNALDYLLDRPASIDCVDVNPRQNALLELKTALIAGSDHDALFGFFGDGRHPRAGDVFEDAAAPKLTDFARKYWKNNLHTFKGKGLRRSFYYFGGSGTVAFWLTQLLKSDAATARRIRQMFDAPGLDEQRELYLRIEPVLLNRFTAFVLNSHVVQSLLGVPRSQQEMARRAFEDGMTGYFRHSFRKVFTELPLRDNYFWKLYFFGKYDADCCPNYLKKENFEQLRQLAPRIRAHTSTLTSFLKNNPGKYTHFVLLDHLDWLAAHDRRALSEEWEQVFENSAPGAKVLFRSASFGRDFLPAFAKRQLHFDDEKTRAANLADRVGTYASTHLATIAAAQ